MKEFGRRYFEDVVRIDLMQNERARSFFDGDLDPRRIVRNIEIETGRRVDPASTLLVIDEIQEAPRALTALKYFCEDAREYHVVAAGSYMGIAMRHQETSFPVGKVDLLTLRPLTFCEFLGALGEGLLAEAVASGDLGALEGAFSQKLTGYLREYFVVGGMPEVVAAYAESHDVRQARSLQRTIISAYDGDFGKHAPTRMLERMRLVWSALPSQLAKENRRFVYGALRSGARARDFEESIQWLCDYGVVFKVPRVSALRHPAMSYADDSAFKLFAVDLGLLGALAGLRPEVVLEGSAVFTEFKGALTEQYVAQELLAAGLTPVYWSADNGTAEVDFAVDTDRSVLPVEVKAAENLKAKSLRVACDRFGLERAVRTSLSGYRDEGRLVNVPLWAVGALPALEGIGA
jgi:hypothetical protein